MLLCMYGVVFPWFSVSVSLSLAAEEDNGDEVTRLLWDLLFYFNNCQLSTMSES